MPLSRYNESLCRRFIEILGLVESTDEKEVLKRIQQLTRGLDPEDEFSLVLSWLGNCKLVHKLGQEQLPLNSTDIYRVPDLFAVFEHEGKEIPVLIEVKKTSPKDPQSLEEGSLSLKPGYLKYADAVGLPMLIAWNYRTFWTLFEMRHAIKAIKNYKIGFFRASEENLLGLLAGDFSYRIVPGTAIKMHIKKLTVPDENGGFNGQIEDVHLVNAAGSRVPDIPYISSLFLFCENKIEQQETDSEVVQSFVIADTGSAEFASRTLLKLVQSFATIQNEDVNWRSIIHNTEHWSHEHNQPRTVIEAGVQHGVIDNVFRIMPRNRPSFL